MRHDAGLENRILDCMPALRRYAASLTRNAADADDLVQETFSRALVSAKSFQPDRGLLPWLLTIERNVFVSTWRRRRREQALGDTQLTSRDDPTERHDVRQVLAALDTLPEDQRDAVTLIALEALSYAEAATVLGVPKGTLMSRLARGRQSLRQALDRPTAKLLVVEGDRR